MKALWLLPLAFTATQVLPMDDADARRRSKSSGYSKKKVSPNRAGRSYAAASGSGRSGFSYPTALRHEPRARHLSCVGTLAMEVI
jgi:hypothetical protein